MGVMSCSRRGCENIMCDRYSYAFGYICNECYKELVENGIGVDIEVFLDTEKKEFYEINTDVAEKIYDSLFPRTEL